MGHEGGLGQEMLVTSWVREWGKGTSVGENGDLGGSGVAEAAEVGLRGMAQGRGRWGTRDEG